MGWGHVLLQEADRNKPKQIGSNEILRENRGYDSRSLGPDLPIDAQEVSVVRTNHSPQASLSGDPINHRSRKVLSVGTPRVSRLYPIEGSPNLPVVSVATLRHAMSHSRPCLVLVGLPRVLTFAQRPTPRHRLEFKESNVLAQENNVSYPPTTPEHQNFIHVAYTTGNYAHTSAKKCAYKCPRARIQTHTDAHTNAQERTDIRTTKECTLRTRCVCMFCMEPTLVMAGTASCVAASSSSSPASMSDTRSISAATHLTGTA